MQTWPPILTDTLYVAPLLPIDQSAVEQAEREAADAADQANVAARRALSDEDDARAAQERIHAHNQSVAGKMFGKPPGWHSLGGGQYLGYTSRDADGDLVPHGEGEQWFQSGNYLCAQFDQQYIRGLWVSHFPNGATRLGRFDARSNTGFAVDRVPHGLVAAGELAPGGQGFAMRLGVIWYPDETVYRGYLAYTGAADYWAPSGFGVWDSGRSLAILGFFKSGWIHGEFAIAIGDQRIGGRAADGHVLAKSKDLP